MSEQFDYVIVGAGSAGCVLAHRLSADPDCRVLLLEAGPRDWHPFIHMPAGLARLVGLKSINWNYETEPEPNLNHRRLYWPRGKVLGGSSSINAMCYVRGHATDYDDWRDLGNPGWGFADVLPYFRRLEDHPGGRSDYHGADGPQAVSELQHVNELSRVFIQAAEQAEFCRNVDFNGPVQRGFGLYHVTQRGGKRCSTAAGYLRPVMRRPNLTVRTGALTTRVLLDGRRATGVEYRRFGMKRVVHAGREVLLAGGAINSPQLLMLSGIGPAAGLEKAGVRVAHDLAGVGGNLQDHLDVITLTRCSQPVTYDNLSEIMVGLNYFLFGRGIGTSNIAEAGGFLRSGRATRDRPDIQMHFVPALLDDHGRNKLPGDGYTVHACNLRPESRGRLELRSDDPRRAPAIHANYLSTAEDVEMMLECVRQARAILSQPAFRPFRAHEIGPGDDVTGRSELLEFIRNKAESIYHPVGTCRMGPEGDPAAVVDPELRVYGIDGLRVVDASIMPTLIGGNTNAPVIMIAEKGADMVLGRQLRRADPASIAEAA
ncbi:MAG: choline dehydrogenase [Wenzhouxiangellaceae bacterium]|nr:choline dehydrogenase [Wenzhouxiangellaceae bacterium]